MLIVSLAIIAVLTAADQIIKLAVLKNYEECFGFIKRYYTFSIGDFDVFSLTHIRNDGAGWSILGGHTVFLIVLTSAIMLFILGYMFVKRRSILKLEYLCLSFIVAGGIGNLIDRIKMLIVPDFNGVIDYIMFDFIDFPVFNFADICVVLGGIGICILYLVLEIKDAKKRKALKSADSDGGEKSEQV